MVVSTDTFILVNHAILLCHAALTNHIHVMHTLLMFITMSLIKMYHVLTYDMQETCHMSTSKTYVGFS